ncbi:MAG: VOC family protein [Gammaproteobacteria bacterium]|nr:VOC family protein [Gammaproteobacteria bacterium]
MGFEVGWNTAVDQLDELAQKLFAEQKRERTSFGLGSLDTQRVRTCLWFDKRGEEAANFYVMLLPNSCVERIYHPDPAGKVLIVNFTLRGVPYQIFEGDPHFQLSPATSIAVLTENQKETDRLWEALIQNGGKEMPCGWLTDQYGLTWQIIPKDLLSLLGSADPDKRERAHAAMMQMKKIDIRQLIAATSD